MSHSQAINSIVILGGGTAGWLSAAILSHELASLPIEIHLVESESIGTIGVGEATIPPFLDVLRSINIDEADFIRKTQATFKLGIRFENWLVKNHDYTHPFGQIGQPVGSIPFFDIWQQAYQQNLAKPFEDYSPAATMIQNGRFYVPSNAPNTPIEAAAYALHLDAGLAAKYFRQYAEQNGVKRTEGKVIQSHMEKDLIESLEVQTSSELVLLKGDFFIDCSGFRSELIGKTLNSKFTDWSHLLPVDRAVTIQSRDTKLSPVTVSRAQDFGWSWHIPLQHRMGNGYVFDSSLCPDDIALDTLHKNLSGEALTEPRFLNFTTGFRQQSWKSNCLAVGLSAGFLEPLESTAIHMITKSLKVFLKLFPHQIDAPELAFEFNRQMTEAFTEIRDFLVFHYCTSRRSDTEFWQKVTDVDMPESLKVKIQLLKLRGWIEPDAANLFKQVNWHAVAAGMSFLPEHASPLIESIDRKWGDALIQELPKKLQSACDHLPSHADFIKQHCPAN